MKLFPMNPAPPVIKIFSFAIFLLSVSITNLSFSFIYFHWGKRYFLTGLSFLYSPTGGIGKTFLSLSKMTNRVDDILR